jgi:hypothetical protein
VLDMGLKIGQIKWNEKYHREKVKEIAILKRKKMRMSWGIRKYYYFPLISLSFIK